MSIFSIASSAGILADHGQTGHQEDLLEHGISPFELVVVNLYPFEGTVANPEVTAEEARKAGFEATTAASVDEAITAITAKDPNARILICGSLYLAGHVLRENGA